MLDRFKIKEQDTVRVEESALRTTAAAIFREMSVPEDDAKIAADVLVTADLRGVDTHGVSNLLRQYVQRYREGALNPNPQIRIVRESLSAATVDSDNGLGIITTPKAMNIAINKAKKTGVGMVTINNGKHLGMAAYHAMIPLKHDMIGVCMTSCPPTVVPTFGSIPRLGTNPISLAAPTHKEAPFVFDAATSVIPDNKVHIARRLGVDLLPGWLADDDGRPVMEPTPAPSPHRLLPLGSVRETGSQKGYGLACIVDILCGVLSLSGFGAGRGRGTFAHFVAAFHVEAFSDTDEFKAMMDDYMRTLRETPPAPGHDRVIYAGLLEAETEEERRLNGIPLHREVIQWFNEITTELQIPNPL